jgi:hypothetical protein
MARLGVCKSNHAIFIGIILCQSYDVYFYMAEAEIKTVDAYPMPDAHAMPTLQITVPSQVKTRN